jgi:ribosome-associated protein
MDIKILQRAIVDGLEDVKGHDIKVFDTTHLTSLFDRVVIASGTSNRQTRSLASSVADKVREAGGRVISTEGGETGEWVLVDCGDAVVHILQPALRQYYNLEELWGGKAVKVKLVSKTRSIAGGVREGSEEDEDDDSEPVINPARFAKPRLAPAKTATPAKKVAAKKVAAKKVAAKKAPSKTVAVKKAAAVVSAEDKPARKTVARKAPAKKVAKAADE